LIAGNVLAFKEVQTSQFSPQQDESSRSVLSQCYKIMNTSFRVIAGAVINDALIAEHRTWDLIDTSEQL
jgi:hypothetical protein